jgi:uncharacterized protein YdeI (YjbR/CyaY-like superfamily)
MRTAAPENSTHPDTRADWRRWLQTNHTRTEGVWLIFWKKASGRVKLDYDHAVEEALCWGWIDSKPRALDEQRTLLWMAPGNSMCSWPDTKARSQN